MKPRTPKFSISIAAMNGLAVTRKCIAGVLASPERWELFLTDNASTDGTSEYFDELAKDPRIFVTHNAVNKGYAEPHNAALAVANGKFFVVLNNDIELPAGWLAKLEQPHRDYPDMAISGPEGSCCSLPGPYPTFRGTFGLAYEFVEGSCLCIPVALAREHGLFPSYMPGCYGEDVDLSLRMRARGLRIHRANFSIVHHRAMTSRTIPNIAELKKQNHDVLLARWGGYLKFRRFDLPILVRRKGALGDVLLTTPIIRALRDQNPNSEIYVETSSPEIFRNNPNVTAAGGPFPQILKWATILDLNGAYESRPGVPYIDAYADAAYTVVKDTRLDLFPDPEELAQYEERLTNSEGKKIVALHCDPSWPGRTWPAARWSELSQWLMENWYVVLVGKGTDAIPCSLDLRGKTTLHELAAVLFYSNLLIGIDSSPLHIAQSQGIQTIGLFGCTSGAIVSPGSRAVEADPAIPCAGGRHKQAGLTFFECSPACIESITVEAVKAEILR